MGSPVVTIERNRALEGEAGGGSPTRLEVGNPQVILYLGGVRHELSRSFEIDESNFAVGETNFVRVRIEDGEEEPFSAPATLTIDSVSLLPDLLDGGRHGSGF